MLIPDVWSILLNADRNMRYLDTVFCLRVEFKHLSSMIQSYYRLILIIIREYKQLCLKYCGTVRKPGGKRRKLYEI